MRKTVFYIIIIQLCLLSSLSFDNLCSTSPPNMQDIKNTASYLSSDKFNGRLAGTLENYETADFIKNSFKEEGLVPYSKNYLEKFNVLYPKRTEGEPILSIKDRNGSPIKEYTYGRDYKEDMLNFRENSVSFSKNNISLWRDNSFQVKKGSNEFLFYNPPEDNLNFRSSFIANSPQSMYIMITKKTAQDINKYIKSGYIVNCFIPFKNSFTSIYNVVGRIKGEDPSLPPLVLSAHFDHLGSDAAGTVYDGALDNASGTSFLLGLVKYIKSLGQPKRDIIIASFNAEEFGCLGSKNFARKYKNYLKGAKVINFDMIGSNKNVPVSIMSGKWDNKDYLFVNEIADICTQKGTNFKYEFQNSSDHEYFRAYGIDAVTLSDADTSRIHTPYDKSLFINTKSIDRSFDIVSTEILDFAFYNSPLLIYCREICLISSISLLILSFLYIKFCKLKRT